MKKILSLLFACSLMLGMTSCIGDSDNDYTTTYYATMYNRVPVAGADSSVFTTDNYTFVINYTQATIGITANCTVNGSNKMFTIEGMTLTGDASMNAYKFSGTSSVAGVTNFQGWIDLNTSVIYLQYTISGTTVFSTSSLPYYHCTTMATTETGSEKSQDDTGYEFHVDPKTNTGTLIISNLYLPTDNSTTISSITFTDVKYKPTSTGFVISDQNMSATPSSSSSAVTINNFNATISGQGLNVSGSYEYKETPVTFIGTMFGD